MMGWFSESREMNPWAEGVYLHLSLMLHHLLSLGSKKEQSFFLRGYCRGFLLQGFRQFLSVYADKFDLGLVLHTSEFINLGWPVKIFYRGIKFYWLSVAYFKEKKNLQNIIFPLFFLESIFGCLLSQTVFTQRADFCFQTTWGASTSGLGSRIQCLV